MLKGKCVLVGVTGGIASYKTLEVVSLLKKRGARVHVIMTKAACEFIKPLSFQTLSQNPVATDMFITSQKWEVEHISLADRADVFLVCPATANTIGKLAAGIADDMLTSTILATRAKVILAPSMNVHMFENPTTQKNMRYLTDIGVKIIEPDEGVLACGYTGKGRLPSAEEIVKSVENAVLTTYDMQDLQVLVTAGPTREPIDPVRFISNYSTGKMGYALARKAALRGAKVTLVSGPVCLGIPEGLRAFIPVNTARDMLNAVMGAFDESDIVIKAAAVADFTPKITRSQKVKKGDDLGTLELEKTEDILMSLGQKKARQVLVGFAAETQDIVDNAKAKLLKKNLDFIVANDLTEKGAGFGSDTNIVKLLFRNGRIEELPKMQKIDIADIILDRALAYIKND